MIITCLLQSHPGIDKAEGREQGAKGKGQRAQALQAAALAKAWHREGGRGLRAGSKI